MSIEILDVRIDPLTKAEALGAIEGMLDSKVPHYIVTVNPEFLMAAQTDFDFRSILNQADLSLADGIGVLWAHAVLTEPAPLAILTRPKVRPFWVAWVALKHAARVLLLGDRAGGRIPQRVKGSELMPELVERCQTRKTRFALIGAKNGVSQQAANALVRRFPKTHIVLADAGLECSIDSHGHLRYDREAQRLVLHRIAATHPDMVFVAFGQRKQEKWIAQSFRHLPSVKLFLGVGGTFDMLAGTTARAPRFFQHHGIEWLWRLLLEPWRLGRICTATIRFMCRVVKEKYQT